MRNVVNESRTINSATVTKAISAYRAIEKYQRKQKEMPSMRDVVAAGVSKSTSHLHSLYGVMEDLGMIEFTRRHGRRRTMSLLPLAEAHPLVVAEIENQKEKETK